LENECIFVFIFFLIKETILLQNSSKSKLLCLFFPLKLRGSNCRSNNDNNNKKCVYVGVFIPALIFSRPLVEDITGRRETKA